MSEHNPRTAPVTSLGVTLLGETLLGALIRDIGDRRVEPRDEVIGLHEDA